MKIAAVIKVKDEADNIADCIASLYGFAHEIVVVDDNSTDRTAEIAAQLGAQVIPGKPHGGLIDRLDRQGFLEVKSDWILRLDADERLTPMLASSLRAAARKGEWNGVRYARRYFFVDGWLDHGGWSRPHHLGFFRSDSWNRNWDCSLHTQVPVNGSILTLNKEFMIHLNYFSIREFIDRSILGYAHTEALNTHKRPPRPSTVAMRAARRFLGRYIIRGGFLDGKRGAVAAYMLVVYDLSIYAYQWQFAVDNEEI